MPKEPWIEKVDWLKKGEGIAAQGTVPQSAEFFQDHFPDFPVLPGVLMLEILKQTAETYLQSVHFSKFNEDFTPSPLPSPPFPPKDGSVFSVADRGRGKGEGEISFRLFEVHDVKFTHFLKPGDEWQSRVEFLNQKENEIECRGRLSSKDRVAASARFAFERVPAPADSITK